MVKNPNELTPETLIKRVMSGKKEYRTNDYLLAFSNISSTELHHPTISRFDVITLWNSLQKTPNKIKYFTFSLTRDNHRTQELVSKVCEHEKYAWICHDKDVSTHKHFHYVLMFNSPRSFKSLANDLELPVTMLEKVYSKKGILDYLTHENDPNKHHYSLSEVTANFDVEEEKKKDDHPDNPDFKTTWKMYCALMNGEISIDEFVDYVNMYCATLGINGQLQVCNRICEVSRNGMGLSTVADFHFHTPVPSARKMSQTAFANVFPEKVQWLDKDSSNPVVFGKPDEKLPKPKKVGNYAKPNPRSDLNDVA